MASVSSFNDKLWRATISDRPRHKTAKQIYYPKESYTKKKAKESATILEYKHKQDEFDLWKMDVRVVGNELAFRQLEGEQTLRFSEVFEAYLNDTKNELTNGTITTYTNLKNSIISELGDFYIGEEKDLNAYVNKGRLNYRKGKKNHLLSVYKWAHKHLGIEVPDLEIKSSKAERNELQHMEFKSFMCEAELLELVSRLREVRKTRYESHIAYYLLMLFYIPRRRSDFIHLKPEWISSSENIIFIGDDRYLPKSQRKEIISPTPEGMKLARIVKNKIKEFPFSAAYITIFFKECIDTILPHYKGKISLHKLRDSGIMHLLHEVKLPISDIKSITGHAHLGSFNKYDHPSGKALLAMKKREYDVNSMLQRKKRFFEEA